MASDISVLIQGPLDKISILQIPYYKTIGPVILSCWNEDDISPYSNLLKENDVQVTINPVPRDRPYKQDTAYLQIMSIYHGLKNVDTKFVIRTRSDEKWGNLQPLLEKKDESKIICGNIFFKRWDNMQRHPGDHLFLGKTDWLLKAYKLMIEDHDRFKEVPCMEEILALAIMAVDDAIDNSKIQFRQRFGVQNINELVPFVAQYKHAGVTYDNVFCYHGTINEMDEL